MKLTVMIGEDRFVPIEVDASEVVEGVKALVEVETGIPVTNQTLLFQGAVLGNHSRLDTCNVKEEDLLVVIDQGGPPQSRPRAAPGGGSTGASGAQGAGAAQGGEVHMRQNEDGSAVDPQAFQQAVLGNRPLFHRLSEVNPSLARAIESGDIEGMQKGLRGQRDLAREQEKKSREDQELMYADPMDPSTQAKIEERIRQENIDLSLEIALEHMPEQFVAVHMLYVEMEVNKHPIKAFVDSGAQQTIMSLACAERCGLMRLLDRRFHGTAVGVGTSKIVGIIHAAPLKIGENFYTCRISVLESITTDFLFGLDMLKRHQCCIDLQANVLRVGAGQMSVAFLSEQDCPKKEFEAMEQAAADAVKKEADAAQASASVSGATPAVPTLSPPTGASAAPAQGVPVSADAKVDKLVELGFTREQAVEALGVTNGNEEQAAGLLFGGF